MPQIIMSMFDNTSQWEYSCGICNGLGLVELDETMLRKLILDRIDLFNKISKKDENLFGLTFWTDKIRVFSLLDSMEEILDQVENEDFLILEKIKYSIPESQFLDIECSQIVIMENEVCWRTIVEKSGEYLETACIPYDVIKKLCA
jgi:hypothetical protein